MGGKSCYTITVALIVLLGQIGSFVPAERADLIGKLLLYYMIAPIYFSYLKNFFLFRYLYDRIKLNYIKLYYIILSCLSRLVFSL